MLGLCQVCLELCSYSLVVRLKEHSSRHTWWLDVRVLGLCQVCLELCFYSLVVRL